MESAMLHKAGRKQLNFSCLRFCFYGSHSCKIRFAVSLLLLIFG